MTLIVVLVVALTFRAWAKSSPPSIAAQTNRNSYSVFTARFILFDMVFGCVRVPCMNVCILYALLYYVLYRARSKSLNFMSNAHFCCCCCCYSFLPYTVPDIGHVSIHPKMQ